jgi:hypothetical protein
MLGSQVEQRFDRRLRVDLGVVALEDRAAHRLEVFVSPVDLERAGDRLDEALVALEHLARPGHATQRQERRVGGRERRRWIGEPFPV